MEYIKLNKNFHMKNTPQSLLVHPHLIPHSCPSLLRKYPSLALQNAWTPLEKETLKKYLL